MNRMTIEARRGSMFRNGGPGIKDIPGVEGAFFNTDTGDYEPTDEPVDQHLSHVNAIGAAPTTGIGHPNPSEIIEVIDGDGKRIRIPDTKGPDPRPFTINPRRGGSITFNRESRIIKL